MHPRPLLSFEWRVCDTTIANAPGLRRGGQQQTRPWDVGCVKPVPNAD
jgi:hypothetical protein